MEKKKHILVIASNYYQEIYDNLINETISEITYHNIHYTLETVTGVFEIPSIITFAKNKFDGYIALGCVIRGETTHYDYVCKESARALMDLSLEGLALGNGIITCENYDQALVRSISGNNITGKGKVAAMACINQIELRRKYTYDS
mgnify:CR=1 FL=1